MLFEKIIFHEQDKTWTLTFRNDQEEFYFYLKNGKEIENFYEAILELEFKFDVVNILEEETEKFLEIFEPKERYFFISDKIYNFNFKEVIPKKRCCEIYCSREEVEVVLRFDGEVEVRIFERCFDVSDYSKLSKMLEEFNKITNKNFIIFDEVREFVINKKHLMIGIKFSLK